MDDRLSQLLDAVWYGKHPLRWLLWPLGQLFEAAVRLRRTLYLRGVKRIVTAQVPVIVVGNVTVGGTGKTPCVIWLADELTRRGFRVGIVSRGYGGRAEHWPQRVRADSDPAVCGDEPVMLARRTGCSVAAGPDRPAAVDLLLREKQIDVVLSDDGLQHYRMGRALEIAVVDGMRGLGNGLCLPAGPLREPPARLRDVDAVVVNGGRWGSSSAFRAELEITGAIRLTDGQRRPVAAFADGPVHGVAAIGHPARFFEMLSEAGLDVLPVALRDHARIDAAQLDFGDHLPVLITEKDAVKCRLPAPDNVWWVPAEMRFANEDGERLMRLVVRELAQGV